MYFVILYAYRAQMSQFHRRFDECQPYYLNTDLVQLHTVWSVPRCCTQWNNRLSLYCQDNVPPFRYVILQIPALNNHFVACEVEVLVRGMGMSNINIVIFTTQVDSCSMLFLLYGEERLLIALKIN